jgi:hypothetical protein
VGGSHHRKGCSRRGGTHDSAAILIKDAVDWDALVERKNHERVVRVEAENAMPLASAREDVEGLARKIALLEGEPVEVRRAQELAEENSYGLFDAAADAEQQWEESERERQEQFKELTLLQTQGSELCLTIVGPPWVRNHLLEGMWITALPHTEMARELAALRAAVSSAAEFALRCSPNKTFWVEIVDELIGEFQR